MPSWRASAHLGRHLLGRDAEDDRRGLAVNVAALAERLDEAGIAREMRHEAQLDLRVVGDEELPAAPGDETAADRLAARGADRDVLEIGLRRAEPAGGGTGLVEAGVDAAGVPVDPGRERVHVGALELLQLAVLEDEPR